MNDAEDLQGTWAVVDLEADGRRIPAASLARARVVVRGDRFLSLGMGQPYEGTFEVDATATPKRLVIRFDGGGEQGITNRGIYELDGDTWRLCLCTSPDGPHPARFAAEPGGACALETLRRTGDVEPVVEKAAEPAGGTDRGPATELEGEWKMVSGWQDGMPLEARMVRTGRRVVRGDETTVLFGTWVYMRVRFTLDPNPSPKTVDYVLVDGPGAGQVQRGIYELAGESLRLCVSPPGQERPADFSTAPGDGRLLTVWTPAGA